MDRRSRLPSGENTNPVRAADMNESHVICWESLWCASFFVSSHFFFSNTRKVGKEEKETSGLAVMYAVLRGSHGSWSKDKEMVLNESSAYTCAFSYPENALWRKAGDRKRPWEEKRQSDAVGCTLCLDETAKQFCRIQGHSSLLLVWLTVMSHLFIWLPVFSFFNFIQHLSTSFNILFL